ncbi:MAG: DMT family transporter [Neisseriaceae bacterium]|nr:DMT family transporter [Neisseriaceae bacterium]
MSKISQKLAATYLILGCIIFGLGGLIVKFVQLDSYVLTSWRLIIATFVFIFLIKIFKQKLPKHRYAYLSALLSGIFLALDLSFWHESLRSVGPGISTLLNSLQIFFLAFIARFFFQEKQTIYRLIGLLLAFIGVVMISLPEWSHNENAAYGIIIGLLSAAMLSLSMTFIRIAHSFEKIDIFPMMFLISISGGITSLLISIVINDNILILPTNINDLILLVIYGVVMQCMAWGMIAYAVPLLSLTLTGLLLLTESIAALFIDFIILHKPISVLQIAGAVLTMIAIAIGSYHKSKHLPN